MSSNPRDPDFMKRLFEGVNSPEDLLRRLEPPAERELVRRAAVLRHFDEKIFGQYLSLYLPDDYSTTFDRFVRNFNLEPVPRTSNIYRVKDEARRACLDELKSEHQTNKRARQDNEEIFRQLLAYYRQQGPETELDRLALLIIVNPQQAQEEFERLYAEADERFDLSYCNDILRTFELRTQLLGERARLLCQVKRQYYNSRNLYAAEFYQTTAYLSRGSTSDDFTQLFAPSSPDSAKWVFHVYATGGMGKTMFVRWLISRCCVPEPRRIPVARLDFDMLDLNSASRYPLLLLLPIADQLNQQIAQRPFTETFKSMWRFKALLDSPTGGEHDAVRFDLERSFQSVEPSWRDSAINEFCRTLKDAKFTGPIVIAIDTLEEMMLLSRESLVRVIRQIEEIHKAYPPLRLVLSGRYDLREALDGLRTMFDTEAVNCKLERFTQTEARTYLTEKRGLKESAFIEAIIEKCADNEERTINPFILSLLADIYISGDVKTVEEIRQLPRAEVAYLTKRIIERIKDDDIRWMLRYASVPRLFTLDILENVMWPHLLAERVEQRGKDSRRKGAGGYNQTDIWQHSAEAATAKEAWTKLRPFASAYGWVSFDTSDGSRMRLHSDISVPMRILLYDEDIYMLLHRDAARYFERKANVEPEQWALWMCEAIYHRFQFEGPKAIEFWHMQLNSKRVETNMEMRVQVASEITKRDYVDEKGIPLKFGKDGQQSLITAEDLCEAHHEAAVASIMLTAKYAQNTSDYTKEWGNVRQNLLKLQTAMKAADKLDFKPRFNVEAFTKLATELNKTLIEHDIVLPLAEAALHSTQSLFLNLSLTIQLAEMYASRDASKAESYFKQARSTSRFLRIPFLSTLGATLKLAQWYQDSGQHLDALEAYENALALHEVQKDEATERHIKYLLAKLNQSIGRYGAAERMSRQALGPRQPRPVTDEDWENALLYSQLKAQELLKPLTALDNSEKLLAIADTARKRAGVMELRGYALGQLMQFEEALSTLEQAKELWGSINDPLGPDRARMYRIELQLNQIGNISEAAYLLEQWDEHGEKNDSELTCQMELLRVRCLHSMGRETGAREKWQALLNSEDVQSSARLLVRVLSTGFVLDFEGRDTFKLLLDALNQIKPPSARLPLLAAFRFMPGGNKRGKESGRLTKMVDWPPEKKETVASALMYADLLRFHGNNNKAEELLTSMLSKSLKEENTFAFSHVLSAFNAFEFLPPPEASIYRSSFLKDYERYPALCRAALLEEAQRALKAKDFYACEKALNDAAEKYFYSNRVTKWDAMAAELGASWAEQRQQQALALSHLDAADTIYRQLGDERSAARLPGKSPVSLAKGTEQTRAGQGRLRTASLDIVEGSISVRVTGTNDSHVTLLGEKTRSLIASLRGRADIFELTDWMVKDPHGFSRWLWEILMAPPLVEGIERGLEESRRPDLCLEIPSVSLAKLPWELAASDGETGLRSFYRHVYRGAAYGAGKSDLARWIQLAARTFFSVPTLKVDGIIGPVTKLALEGVGLFVDELNTAEIYASLVKMLREKFIQRQLKALSVAPSFETLVASQRGSGRLEGSSLNYLYERLSFDLYTVDVSDSREVLHALSEAVPRFMPQVIHIESSFITSPTTGQVYLDFNSEAGSDENRAINGGDAYSGNVLLSATLLNDMLLKLPDNLPRPLVIIEAQSPPGRSALALQMLLRNSFAYELFHLGNTCGVLATGLFPPTVDRQQMLAPLLNSLSTARSLGNAVNAVNAEFSNLKPTGLSDSPSSALYTNDPAIILLPT